MERKRAIAAVLMGLAVWVVPCEARLVTVAITAEVGESIEGFRNSLGYFQGEVQVGDTIVGTYTYDTSQNPSGQSSDGRTYEFFSSPCGVVLEVGGYTFQTDPNDVQLMVRVWNNTGAVVSDIDRIRITSSSHAPVDDSVEITSIELLLNNERYGTPYYPLVSVLSAALSGTAPDLELWPMRELTIASNVFRIYAQITSATLASGPPKVVYVDDDAVAGGDGSSWDCAYRYLQDALVDANAADKPVEVRVAQGRYRPDQGAGRTEGDREAAFVLMDEVSSPCIDTGDPASPLDEEPVPNGGRINMGAYGGTTQASKSTPNEVSAETFIP